MLFVHSHLMQDYMNATGVPGWSRRPMYISSDTLGQFATSQVEYMSYMVSYGNKNLKYVHNRAPHDGKKYICQQGFEWLYNRGSNLNTITGAMVAGIDKCNRFKDLRQNYSYTEPNMAGNAGLMAALISLTTSGGLGVDKNTIFSAVPPLYPDGSSSEY